MLTSAFIPDTLKFSFWKVSQVSFTADALREEMTTLAPYWAQARAIALPIPRVEPVITTTLSLSFIVILHSYESGVKSQQADPL